MIFLIIKISSQVVIAAIISISLLISYVENQVPVNDNEITVISDSHIINK